MTIMNMTLTRENFVSEIRRIFLFLVIGVFQTILSYILWNVLLFGCSKVGISNTAPLTLSVTNFLSGFMLFTFSFVLHRRVTFKGDIPKDESIKRSLIIFYTSYSLTALFTAVLVYISVANISSDYIEYIKIIITLFNAALNFLVQRLLLYNKKSQH